MEDKAPARKGSVVDLFGEDAPPAFEPTPWRDGIVAHIRPIPPAVDRRLRREFTANLKARQLGEQSAEKVLDKGEALTLKRAVYALSHFDGFVFRSASAEICGALAAAAGVPVTPGQEVDLEGRWTDAVKGVVLHYAPKLSAWVSDKADKLSKQEAQAEEEVAGN